LHNLLATALAMPSLADAPAFLLLAMSCAAVWFCRPKAEKRSQHKIGEFAADGH
jgi:hypothetical protein